MQKTAENCGGRSGARSPDLLGVNERDRRQIRRLVQTAKRRFPNTATVRSVSVPDLGTECTTVALTADEMERTWGDFDPGPIKFKMPPPNFLVYFVGGETGPVKIGWTQQAIKARLVCIQNGSPVKLHVLATANRHRIAEKQYHKQFAAHRLHGEWFERCPEIEAEIARLAAPS